MAKDEEIWKQIPNMDGYEVSNLGNIRSFRIRRSGAIGEKSKELIPQKTKTHCKEYYRISLMISGAVKRFYMHRLIAVTFLPNIDNKPQVNHKDGNGLNNHAGNLEWCSNSENQIHRFKLAGNGHNLGQYIHKNRSSFRVYKKGVIDKCFKDLTQAQQFAQNYY